MNNKKNIIIAVLIAVVLGLLAYLLVDSQNRSAQTNNQNSPAPVPTPAPAEPPTPSPTPAPQESDDVKPAPSEDKFVGNWLLTGMAIDGKTVDMNVKVPQPVTLNFDKSKKTYNGFAGCNSFSGKYTASGSDKLDLGATVSTKKYCMESSDLENKLFGAMDKVDRYMITPEGELVLRSSNSQVKIQYKPAI